MKKILLPVLAFISTGFFYSCEELEKTRIYETSDIVAPVLTKPGDIAITLDNMDEEAVFEWTATDYGVKVAPAYAIEASLSETGEKTVLASDITGLQPSATLKTTLKYAVINDKVFNNLGVPSDIATDVYFYISSLLAGTEKIYSAPQKAKVTVTSAEKTYPMVYVIGNYNGWNDATMQKLYNFDEDEVKYSGMIGFGGKAAEGFKIKGTAAGWDDNMNWGLDGSLAAPEAESEQISLITSGSSGNIGIYSKDFYCFTFDRSSLSLKVNFSFNTLSITGDATGGWGDGFDTVMEFDTNRQLFYADISLSDGEIKFRADKKWDASWGAGEDKNFLTGANGSNIGVKAGNYRITVNMNNPAQISYSISADDYGK